LKKTSIYSNKNFPPMGCCSGSTENTGSLANPMDSEDSEEQPGEPSVEGSREDSLHGELEVKEKPLQEQVPIIRDPKHVFSIKFKKKPLGIVLTSANDGTSGYVTEVNGKKNKAVKNDKLPLNSKLLKLNGKDIELHQIDDITEVMVESMNSMPLELTFCHPDGLTANEVPDPNPTDDYTK